MKKWLIPNELKTGVKLVADYKCPEGAICEVPDHYTNEMEPFIKLGEKFLPDGSAQIHPEIDPQYFEFLKSKGQIAIPNQPLSSQIIKELAVTRVKKEAIDKFNSMNPFQRFIKSILGDLTDSAESIIVQQILKFIFKDKVSF